MTDRSQRVYVCAADGVKKQPIGTDRGRSSPFSSTATQVHQGLHGPGRMPQGGRHGRLHHLGRKALQGRVRQVRAWIEAPSHPIHAWRNAHPAIEKTKPTLPTAPHHQTPTPKAGSSTKSAASSPWPTRAATRTAPSSSSPSRPAATSTTSTPSSAASSAGSRRWRGLRRARWTRSVG